MENKETKRSFLDWQHRQVPVFQKIVNGNYTRAGDHYALPPEDQAIWRRYINWRLTNFPIRGGKLISLYWLVEYAEQSDESIYDWLQHKLELVGAEYRDSTGGPWLVQWENAEAVDKFWQQIDKRIRAWIGDFLEEFERKMMPIGRRLEKYEKRRTSKKKGTSKEPKEQQPIQKTSLPVSEDDEEHEEKESTGMLGESERFTGEIDERSTSALPVRREDNFILDHFAEKSFMKRFRISAYDRDQFYKMHRAYEDQEFMAQMEEELSRLAKREHRTYVLDLGDETVKIEDNVLQSLIEEHRNRPRPKLQIAEPFSSEYLRVAQQADEAIYDVFHPQPGEHIFWKWLRNQKFFVVEEEPDPRLKGVKDAELLGRHAKRLREGWDLRWLKTSFEGCNGYVLLMILIIAGATKMEELIGRGKVHFPIYKRDEHEPVVEPLVDFYLRGREVNFGTDEEYQLVQDEKVVDWWVPGTWESWPLRRNLMVNLLNILRLEELLRDVRQRMAHPQSF